MALKAKLNQADYDKLSDEIKLEYKKVGDDFMLDVEGAEDIGALKRAKDREAQLRKDAETARKTLQDELDAIKAKEAEGGDIDARKRGDIETLEKSWKAKLEAEEKKGQDTEVRLTRLLEQQLVDKTAHEIAAEISTSPALILPHIRARLAAEVDGDKAATRVLDKDGKPSAATLDDFKKELVANKDFAAIIVASKASGGGASNHGQGSGGGASGKELSKMSEAERTAMAREDPAAFKQIVDAERAKRQTAR